MNLPGVAADLLAILAFSLSIGLSQPTSGAVLYQDNFDNVAVGEVPSPVIGTYIGGQALVSNGIAVPPSPDNYLDSFREQDEDFYGDLAGAPVSPGSPVHAEWTVFIVDGHPAFGLTDSQDFFLPHTPLGSGIMFVAGSTDGSVIALNSAGAVVTVPEITHKRGEWETWAIDYVVGEPGFDLTIGDTTVMLDSSYMLESAAAQVEGITTYTFSGFTRVLIDDVLVTGEPGSLPGDFNVDGSVDAADYTVWRDGLGSTYTLEQYDIWKANFGMASGSGFGSVAVPEPASLTTLMVMMSSIIWLRRVRWLS